jgi:hypothetical protein
VNFPDVLLIANEYQISVPPPFVRGSEFAGVVVEIAGETAISLSATASREPVCTAHSPNTWPYQRKG